MEIVDGAGVCTEPAILTVVVILRFILNVVRILVPIVLVVLGSIDIGKAVIAGDEKKIKEAQKPFVKRVIAAVIVFLIPWIVDIIMQIVASESQYGDCWELGEEYSISQISEIMNTSEDELKQKYNKQPDQTNTKQNETNKQKK